MFNVFHSHLFDAVQEFMPLSFNSSVIFFELSRSVFLFLRLTISLFNRVSLRDFFPDLNTCLLNDWIRRKWF